MRYAVSFLFVAFLAAATSAAQNKQIKTVPVHDTQTLEGSDLFSQYCAVCHGPDGRGGGPAADALKKRPADLTQIARRNNGKFNDLLVQNVINGEQNMTAHGSRDMPVWGTLFKSVSGDDSARRLRLYALVKYIEQLQAK